MTPLPSSIYSLYPCIDISVATDADHYTVIAVEVLNASYLVGAEGVKGNEAAATRMASLISESPMSL